LNYIPAFFKEHAGEATGTYSLIAMKPHLKLDAREQAIRFLQNPLTTNYADAVSAIYSEKLSGMYLQLFIMFDLIKALLRTDVLQGLASAQILSKDDRAARSAFDETVDVFENSAAEARPYILQKYFDFHDSEERASTGKGIFSGLRSSWQS
jgi:hypothetical protein